MKHILSTFCLMAAVAAPVAAQEVVSDPTHLAYFNNEGTPVNVDYKMYISVEVAHKWGVLKKEALEVNVHKADGTPNN